jgi:choline dehydrogenase-like flavoprotein
MGSTAGANAVADGKLCVRGVGGLGVANASVMPKVPGRHTEIPVKMLNAIERLQISAVGGVREI